MHSSVDAVETDESEVKKLLNRLPIEIGSLAVNVPLLMLVIELIDDLSDFILT